MLLESQKNEGSLGSGNFPDCLDQFDKNKDLELVQRFRIERVQDAYTLEKEWEPLLVEIFDDENDREPIDLLKERLENGENFFLMRNAQGEAVGIELSQILLDTPPENSKHRAMYVPWTGVTEDYRNNGIGSEMNRAISNHMRQEYGVTHTIIDIEDPERMHDSGYAPEELDEAIDFAKRRINFWRREGFLVVDDESKPAGEKFEYCRPASDDEQNIQAYDHLTVRVDDDALACNVLSENGERIDKNFIRECYMDMTRIQFGNLSEEELRQEYPAVDKYLTDIDNVPDAQLRVRSSPITPKSTANAKIQVSMLSSVAATDMGYDEEYSA